MRTGERLRMEGRLEGRLEGAVEAQRNFMLRLVRLRFGAPPAWVEAKILAADSSTLDGWFDLAITAPTLDAVFNPPSPAG